MTPPLVTGYRFRPYLLVQVNNRNEFSGGSSDLLWDIAVGIRTAMKLDGCWCLKTVGCFLKKGSGSTRIQSRLQAAPTIVDIVYSKSCRPFFTLKFRLGYLSTFRIPTSACRGEARRAKTGPLTSATRQSACCDSGHRHCES